MSYSKFVKTMLTVGMVTILISLAIAGVGCATAKDVFVDETTSEEETTTAQVAEAFFEAAETYVNGIDVSYCQGNINATAIPSNIEMVVVRMGRSTYGSWSIGLDTQFVVNVKKFAAKSTDIALYWYSTAITEAEAIEEAQYIARELNKLGSVKDSIKYLFIDRESSDDNGRADNISSEQLNKVLIAQLTALEEMEPDLLVGIYTNIEWLKKLDVEILKNVPAWIAWTQGTDFSSFDQVIERVERDSDAHAAYLESNMVMWQYSFEGSVSGISGDVDLNLVSSKMLG